MGSKADLCDKIDAAQDAIAEVIAHLHRVPGSWSDEWAKPWIEELEGPVETFRRMRGELR